MKTQVRRYMYVIVPLILIMGLRHVSVGNDTEQYLYRYDNSLALLTDPYVATEFGYNYLGYFFHYILGADWQVYLFCASTFICISLLCFVIRFSPNVYLSLFFYMSIGLFYMNMSGLRQSLAIALSTFALLISVAKKGNKKHDIIRLIISIAVVYGAFTIHNSAFIFFPLLFCTNFRFSKKQVFFILVVASSALLLRPVIVQYAGVFLPVRYQTYDLNTEYLANPLVQVIPIVIPLYCLIKSNTENDGKYDRKISLMFIFAALNIFFMSLLQSNNQIGRLAYYFLNSYTILIPYTFYSQTRNNDNRIVNMLVILVCFMYFLISVPGGTLSIDNYKFFWQ
ncbi:EpsG family protein [uncultured Alistipes sp.]|uniref:EpsG family protein n=1 Tax=uncultured Alistipes sp. TaxID=538949 RepID=UPI0025D9E41F|nr:EpsG family protein [uncultured Alistipes sp.]